MEDIFAIVIFRTITRSIGHYARYIFFKIIGKKISWKSLSNESKDEYKDIGKALKQDFYNAVIGSIIFFILTLIIIAIIFN
jgi:hypothetical protein